MPSGVRCRRVHLMGLHQGLEAASQAGATRTTTVRAAPVRARGAGAGPPRGRAGPSSWGDPGPAPGGHPAPAASHLPAEPGSLTRNRHTTL
jgi:hypothetical protein